MKRRSITPLRTTFGQPIPLYKEAVAVNGPLAANVVIGEYTDFADVELPYDDFLPSILNIAGSPTDYVRGVGVGSMPRPKDLPSFNQDLPAFIKKIPFLAITWIGDIVDADISRELWFELEINVPETIALHNADLPPTRVFPADIAVGGVFYGGWPYMPYYVSEEGENSANFGLPREMRLTWDAGKDAGFVDAENAITRQSPAAHSGVHIFPCGPLRPGILRVRFSDMPRAMIRLTNGGAPLERWICVIPYLFLFEHREGARYEPRAPAGLLGAWRAPARLERTYASVLDQDVAGDAAANIAPDMLLTTGNPLAYHPMSVASLFAGRRTFPSVDGDREFFLSDTMETGDAFWICVEQGGDSPRCLAGLSIGHLKSAIDPVKDVETRVYELDPIGGVSPLDPARPPDEDRYSTLVGRMTHPTWAPAPTVLRFQRPSRARFLAIRIGWMAGQNGRLAFDRFDLLQSAHVTVAPRRSREQLVTALHFRLISPDLAGDYATIGSARFSMLVDHVVAGETKEILLEASSLHDLVRLPGVQVLSNQRYLETLREVVEEDAATSNESWERLRSETRATGWRRSRSGAGTAWTQPAGGKLAALAQTAAADFRVEESGEARSKTRHLGFQSFVEQMRNRILDLGVAITDDDNWTLPSDVTNFLDAHTTPGSLRDGWDDLWTCLAGSQQQIDALLEIDGLRTLALPPFALPADIAKTLLALLSSPLSATPQDIADLATKNPFIGRALAIQGVSLGGNLGIGTVGMSVSSSPQLPNMVATSTTGTTGAVTHQASKQGCAYAQHRNDAFDDADVHVSHIGDGNGVAGRLKRRVVRDLLHAEWEHRRQAGVNVHWQGLPVDIVTGTIQLGIVLSATADKIYRTSDEAVRVRFPNGVGDLIVDVWFDVVEEVIRNDY